MAYTPKSTSQEFTSGWSKAIAWAGSQGIPTSSWAPVYQLDLTRIKNGEYPMSASERNYEILAANNPNSVTSAPTDNPNPSNVMGNTIHDVGLVATGLIGIFTGSFEKQLWHSAQATAELFTDPQRFAGHGLWGTVGNVLNDTLLSYLPGTADLAQIMEHGFVGGLKQLAEHPLVSLLDLQGMDEVFSRVAATGVLGEGGAAAAAKMAAAPGLLERGAKAIGGISTGKAGVTLGGELSENLSVGDQLEKIAARIGPGGSGVGPKIAGLVHTLTSISAMKASDYSWLMDASNKVVNDLTHEQHALVVKVLDTTRTKGGDLYRETLNDPAVDPKVKEALTLSTQGPLRFAVEESIFNAQLRPVYDLDGRRVVLSPDTDAWDKVSKAMKARQDAERKAVKSIDSVREKYAAPYAHLQEMLPRARDQLVKELQAARAAVANDAGWLGNATQEMTKPTRGRAYRGLDKSKQVQAVIREGGLVDKMLDVMQSETIGPKGEIQQRFKSNPNPAQIGEIARQMKARLSKWAPGSVDAAEVPALAGLAQSMDAFVKWSDASIGLSKKIDEAIHGEVRKRGKNLEDERRYQQHMKKHLTHTQSMEREDLFTQGRLLKGQLQAEMTQDIAKMREDASLAEAIIKQRSDQASVRATQVEWRKILKDERAQIKAINDKLADQIKIRQQEWQIKEAERKATFKTEREALEKLHRTQRAEREFEGKAITSALGYLTRQVADLGAAISGFHDAVMDNPSDEYRDAFVTLYQKHLLNHEQSAILIAETERRLKDKSGWTEKRLAELRSNPQSLGELVALKMRELYQDPLQDPEVAKLAKDATREAEESARHELKTLIAQGLRLQYIPTATSLDTMLGRNSMSPLIGHGIPKPSMTKAKVWDLTPRHEDFALGINKAVVQALQRDATIEFAESLSPYLITRQKLEEFILQVERPELREAGGTIPNEFLVSAMKRMGVRQFDPESLFGFRLGRWGVNEMYAPESIVDALEKLMLERKHQWKALGATNKIFRYSILGLSPRYTSHILFGGTFMLALRSSPKALGLIGDAARALREGTLPEGTLRGAVSEMGFTEMPWEDRMLQFRNKAGGQEAVRLGVQEHIETVQKVARGLAKPIHVLRALADMNFRFTRYVRDMQGAIAYLDGAANAAKGAERIEVEDPITGKMIPMTPKRAVAAGMHHVEQVFGNLDRMSPFERQLAQTVMPFYGWQKHILGYVMTFPFDHPWRAMVLSQMAYRASASVPLAYPVRIQLLLTLGTPGPDGNMNAIDIRSLDPFRDVANYASLTGVFESLNPALSALPSILDPSWVYGSNTLYPNLTYDSFYGIETAGPQGNIATGLEQFVPQLGAAGSALSAVNGVRSEWTTNRRAAIKSMLENLNVPFVTPPVNLKQIAARDEGARYQVAKAAAYNAFQAGDFSSLRGYKTVPNPLNPAYEITPAQLEALYNESLAQNPSIPPIEALLPPPTPAGW